MPFQMARENEADKLRASNLRLMMSSVHVVPQEVDAGRSKSNPLGLNSQ
jgi:hypothetical protein